MSRRRPILLASALFLILAQNPLWAAPPGHAAESGMHKQQAAYYMGYLGRKWDDDYGITRGRCNRDAAAASGAKVATAVGARIGHDIDQKDATCIGHALELARVRHRVTWIGEGGVHYRLRPLHASVHDGLPCREFELVVGKKRQHLSACQREPGAWQLR